MRTAALPTSTKPATLGVVIRFSNSAATLPAVLDALRRQTVQPDLIVGVSNQSSDGSVDLLRAAGAEMVDWTEPYRHPQVLNFALRHCPTDLVVILSSHTVLESPDAIAKLVAAMADPRTACASGRWDADPFYSDAIDWQELQSKGLKFCSIYSNSMGILRRSLWEDVPFDESLPTMEDSGWALEQLKRGYICRRPDFALRYQRSGKVRDFIFAVVTFKLARRHGLAVTWLGWVGTLRELWRELTWRIVSPHEASSPAASCHFQRLAAWFSWRFVSSGKE